MMYRVLNEFHDKQDNYYLYRKGDLYPRGDKKVTAKRISELSTDKNAAGIPLITEINDKVNEVEPERSMKNDDTADGDMQ